MLAHGISWLAVISTAIVTAMWFTIVSKKDGWGAIGFLITALCLGGGTFLFGVIPSGVLYFKKRERRDLLSLWMSGFSCIAVAGESASLFFVKLNGS